MAAHTYPGKGLSLPQLVFALNEELKRAAYSPSFTFDSVSQLDRDTSTALANIREWRNSFTCINRVPLDVLSLIPTHLSSQKDRFRATHVCRHWRRTFLQHAALWSFLLLPKGEVYVKNLLERAKGSPLDVVTNTRSPIGTIRLLSPHASQIRYLNFIQGRWTDVRRFSEVNSGPLPLLHTLEINSDMEFGLLGLDDPTPPSLPLFNNAVNLKRFILRSRISPFLNHFVFPNITMFEFSIASEGEEFRALELLNFLEASPVLQKVGMRIMTIISLEGVAQGRIVTLPDVQTFSLAVDDGAPGYELATHISCPSASSTSLAQEKRAELTINGQDMFTSPTVALWNTIARQYTRRPVEAVTLKIDSSQDSIIECDLTFRSLDMTTLGLRLEVFGYLGVGDEFQMTSEDITLQVFSQAFRIVRDHPLLPNIKHLYIECRKHITDSVRSRSMANEVGRLFGSMGPLDRLILHGCDLRLYLAPFLEFPEFEDMEQPIAFPPIRELKISHPSTVGNEEEYMAAIAELAKSQHVLGVPFGRVTVRGQHFPTATAEMLGPWVGEADYRKERYTQAYDE